MMYFSDLDSGNVSLCAGISEPVEIAPNWHQYLPFYCKLIRVNDGSLKHALKVWSSSEVLELLLSIEELGVTFSLAKWKAVREIMSDELVC